MSTVESQEPEVTERLCDFIDLTAQRDDLRDQLKKVEDQRSEVERELTERFAMNGLQSVKLKGHTIYLQVEQHASVKAEFRQDAIDAARRLELEDMITLQPQRFAAWCREQLRDEATGGKLPTEFEGLVTVYEKASMRMRRS